MFASSLLLFVGLVLAAMWWAGPGWRPRPLPGVSRVRPWALGHRGARHVRPENTAPAFELAFAVLDGIETDVQRTRDGVLVLWHDFDVEGIPVTSIDFATLRAHEPSIVTLQELFRIARDAPGTVLNLELKSDPRIPRGLRFERDVVVAVRASGLEDRILISSFDPLSLLRLRLIAPSLRTALLTAPVGPGLVRSGALARWLHVDALHPEDSQVTQALLSRCKRRGLPVHAWTVNDPGRMRSLAMQGVGAVMADDPERLAAELQAVRVGAP